MHPSRSRTLLPMLVLWIAGSAPGCGGQASGDAGDPVALAACLVGIWLNPATTACLCGGGSSVPECGSSDCRNWEYLWLRSDGVAVEGFFSASVSLATFSSTGGTPRQYPYLVGPGTLEVDPANRDPYEVSCGATRMVWGLQNYDRAAPGVSGSVQAAWGSGNGWTAAAYAP